MHVAAKWVSAAVTGVVGVSWLIGIDARADAASLSVAHAVPVDVPAWLFVLPPTGPAPVWDSVTRVRIPGSRQRFTDQQLHDLFSAPDWTPTTHAAMPPVVSRGRRPTVYACGYCHMPDGAGRPENVMLAGLPAAYIVRQMADIKSGARRSVWPAPWAPSTNMALVALNATDAEIATAAAYFASRTPRQRTRIVEAATIPMVLPAMGTFRLAPGGGREPLGGRVVEVPTDFERHERRDPNIGYIAYVPVGSIARGRALVARSVAPGLLACTGCHGPQLRGEGDIVPPIAGRSPAYLIRQLLGYQHGTRASTAGAVMRPVAAAMTLDDMIAVAAYAATLTP